MKKKPVTNKAKTKMAPAYHEAGHAVMAYLKYVPLRRAALCTDHPEGLGGFVTHKPLFSKKDVQKLNAGFLTPGQREKLDRAAMISLAGWVAQRHYAPRSVRRHHARSDRFYAQDCVARFEGLGSKPHVLYLNYLDCKVEETITSPRNWKLVKALAKKLHERRTLNKDEIHKIFDEALGLPPISIGPKSLGRR